MDLELVIKGCNFDDFVVEIRYDVVLVADWKK